MDFSSNQIKHIPGEIFSAHQEVRIVRMDKNNILNLPDKTIGRL
jgi:hypothetical protein